MSGNEQGIQAFEKKEKRGGSADVLPLFTGLAGFGCAAIAIGTAVAPASVGGVTQVVSALDRVGLDKGPLALFGATLFAMALTMRRSSGSKAAANASEEASLIGQQVLGDVGTQNAAIATLQAELGAARAELAEFRQEASAALSEGGHGSSDEASDPMFRMAASLDQLGAQVGKRMDATRAELLEAVKTINARVDELGANQSSDDDGAEAAEQRQLIEDLRESQASAFANAEAATASSQEQFESLRADVSGLIEAVANLARPAETPAYEAPEETVSLPQELAEETEACAPESTQECETPEYAYEEPAPQQVASEAHGAPESGDDCAREAHEVAQDVAPEPVAEQPAPVEPPAPYGLPFATSEEALGRAPVSPPTPPAEIAPEAPAAAEMPAPLSMGPAPEISPEPQPAPALPQLRQPEPAQPFEDGAAASVEEPAAPLPAAEIEPLTPPLPFGSELTQVAPSAADEAPQPPPPLPAPSEGLELIDEMQADRARAADLTPPLFPELRPDHGDS